MADSMRGMFVTGMLRSGTTLLDKLLHRHPSLCVASQPFFNFYADLKSAFLGPGAQRLPFTPGFMEPEQGDFQAWLGRERVRDGLLAGIEKDCTGAKGQGAPSLRGRITGLAPGTPLDVWRQLHAFVAAAYGDPREGGYIGSKEVLCEEFLPYLAASGVRCLLSVRDPRAVIASIDRGRYRASVGDSYPILLNLRNWRKSVAYFLLARRTFGMLALRYEDVVGGTGLDEVARFLGIAPFDPAWYSSGMHDQEGQVWEGNSSFGNKRAVDGSRTEQWRTALDPATIRFIEFCTYPELRALGYPVGPEAWDPDHARAYREDVTGLRQEYARDYALDARNLEAELARREWLQSAAVPSESERRAFFLSDAAFQALRGSIE